MDILILPGIWPPDVGGPATHGPELARFLGERGHGVRVVTMGDGEPTERPCPVEVVPRSQAFPVRYGLLALRGAAAARECDVVYASATYAAAAAAAEAARRPLVAKLVSDPAYERARRWGLVSGSPEEFPAAGGPAVAALRRARTAALRRARRVVVPSRYLAEIAVGWGLDEGRVEVLPNPAPRGLEVEPERLAPGTLVFAGRLTAQKALGAALEAVAALPGARIVLVGDGPERGELERRAAALGLDGRAEFRGAQSRQDVLRALAGATAAVLPSAWENLPHAAVEALAVGTPVVATAVGGVPEVVHDGENGLLVPPGDPEALREALARVLGDPELRGRLAAGARASLEAHDPERVYGRLEAILREAART
jgi:glycosyltransferase involved in cell wall biosynthesis